MGSQVVTGATLQCSMGTFPSSFAATGIAVSATSPAGVITDTGPENVPPFGLCMSPINPEAGASTPPVCLPIIVTPWTPGALQVTVGGVPALDDASQCSCAYSGLVTVTDAGQTSTTVQ
jgi:hypothetical protein